MSWHANQLKYAVGLGGIMSFYGAVSLIVMLLPSDAFGGRKYQIVTIGLVLLTLPFALIIMFVASRRAKKKAAKEAEAAQQAADPASASAPAAAQAPSATVGSFADLTSSTEEAVQFLKTSNLGSSGRDAVYSLPWYLVAGAPHSGKSSLVLSSNLNFQTLPSQRQSEQKFLRPTGSIDWRVTSDAVFVDTAGRYQTEGVDSEEWASLLETLKKYRGNRPVDGFLLVVDTAAILKADERQMEELAKVLRARLDETMQRLKVRFPVYLVFTHADAIEGFRDSFSSSKNEDKTLVWGATIPIEKSENAQALFDSEYEILHNSLMKRRIVRLSAPFPAVRQLRIFNFPLHFGTARRKFGTFVNALFRPNPFSENPFLRGFYFTASPVAKTNGAAPPAVGNPYFTERFFRDVVLRDKDLVKTFQESRKRAPIFGWLMTILGGLIVFGFLVMSAVSLANNRQLLQRAEDRGLEMKEMIRADGGANPLDKKPDAVKAELNETERMRELLADLDRYDTEGPPLTYRFGFYSGTRVFKEALMPMYLSVVEQRFKAPAIAKLREDLDKFAKSKPVANPGKLTPDEEKNLEQHLNRLKAYLMLTRKYKDNAQSSHVANVLKEYWIAASKTPTEMKAVAEEQLEFWSKQIHRDDVNFERIPLDEELVAGVRNKLKDYPAEYRYLSRKVTEISQKIDEETGPTTLDQILSRNSSSGAGFISGTHSVPNAYTRRGLDLMKVAIETADEEMKKDDWVMGPQDRPSGGAQIELIENRYYTDYALTWAELVRSTDVRPYKNRAEAAEALRAFSQPDSAINVLVKEIVKNTDFSIEPEAGGLWPWLKSWFVSKKEKKDGVTEPEKAFRPLFRFVGKKEEGENAPIEKYKNELGKLQDKLAKVEDRGMEDITAKMASGEDPLDIKRRENEIAKLTGQFDSPASKDVAALLMEPIDNLRTLLGAGEKEQIVKLWAEQTLSSAKEMEKGYPFADGGSDADMKAISAYLAPGEGKLSKLYDERLKNYIEAVNGEYKLRPDSKVQFTDEFLTYLTNAFALQKALFGTSPTPKFEYEFTLRPVKETIIDVSIDGQKTDSQGTGSIKGTFPGANAPETGVIMKLASLSGPIATTPSSSANSSNSNVSSTSGSPPESSAGQIVEQGQWGLFKFVDRGNPEKQPGGEYLLKYTVGGKSVTATIKGSGGDLFDKNMFRRVKAPQNIIK